MKNCLLIGFLFILCACQPKISARGNITLAEKLNTFVVGKTKADDVIEACGSPSLRKDELTWIYIGARSEEVSFRDVKLKDKIVVRMTFDHNGVLKSLENISQNNSGKRIASIDEQTDLITDKQAAALTSNVR